MAVNVIEVSLLAGDPDNEDITVAQIGVLSGLYGTNSFVVALAAARFLMRKFAKQVSKKAGDVSINSSDKFKHYKEIVADLQREVSFMALDGSSAYAGGISISDKDTNEADTDRVEPYFTRELHDDPGRDELTNEEY
jgi:hypothetical protein